MKDKSTADIDLAELDELNKAYAAIREQMSRQIVGQNDVVDQLLIAVFARGHCILEGVPGLAKTLMVHSLAESLALDFNRIQFTPDLMPSDITGTEVLYEDRNSGARELRFVQGPIFANLILADEINRTPPKTQAALLEAMQERQVTAGGHRHVLPDPFFVLATQNPIEQEGTYPLPEAQLDRFLFKIFITYPKPEEERRIYRLTTGATENKIEPTLDGARIAALQRLVRRVPVSDHCIDYAMDLVRATRGPDHGGPKYIADWVAWGAGPRAGQSLILAAKAKAALMGRPSVSVEDIQSVAPPVLAAPHRHQLQRPGRRRIERLDRQEAARRRADPERTSQCRRRGNIPILTRSPRFPTWSCARAGWSKVRSAVSTAARFTGSTSNSPSTASTRPATICAGSIGASSRDQTGITSSNMKKRATSASPSSSTPAIR